MGLGASSSSSKLKKWAQQPKKKKVNVSKVNEDPQPHAPLQILSVENCTTNSNEVVPFYYKRFQREPKKKANKVNKSKEKRLSYGNIDEVFDYLQQDIDLCHRCVEECHRCVVECQRCVEDYQGSVEEMESCMEEIDKMRMKWRLPSLSKHVDKGGRATRKETMTSVIRSKEENERLQAGGKLKVQNTEQNGSTDRLTVKEALPGVVI